MPRPVIGIVTQTLPAVPGERPACWVMGRQYVEALREAGAVPWLVPLLPGDPETMRAVFDRLDGVFLAGGADVDPSSYGEPRHPLCGHTDPDRDATEVLLLRPARPGRLPGHPSPQRRPRRDALPGRGGPGAGGAEARLLPDPRQPEPGVPGSRRDRDARLPVVRHPRRVGGAGEQHAPPGDQGPGRRAAADRVRPGRDRR